MRAVKIALLCMIVFTLTAALSSAANHSPVERGKALFNDPKFAGGEKACSDCHPLGGGLTRSANKKTFRIYDETIKGLEEAVNFCIVEANMGNAIELNSDQMKDIVEYIKSLQSRRN